MPESAEGAKPATKGKGLDLGKVQDSLKKIPWWGYAIAGGGALALVYYIRKGQSGQQSSAQNSAASAGADQGLQMADLAGLPYDTFDADYNSAAGTTPTPAGYDPDDYPPSGSPPVDLPPPSPGTRTPPSQPSPVRQPPPSGSFTHMFHTWPAWDSTLSGVARREGMTWQNLYGFDGNKAVIDAEAHAHGHYTDEYNWVFPGEVIHVPKPIPAS